jgi:hypothetical protein
MSSLRQPHPGPAVGGHARPEQSEELGPDAPQTYGLPSWLLALGLVGQLGGERLDLPAEPLAELAPGRAQAAAGVQRLSAGPGLLGAGPGEASRTSL